MDVDRTCHKKKITTPQAMAVALLMAAAFVIVDVDFRPDHGRTSFASEANLAAQGPSCVSQLVMDNKPQGEWPTISYAAKGKSVLVPITCAGTFIRFTYKLGYSGGGSKVHIVYQDSSVPECIYDVSARPACTSDGLMKGAYLEDTTGQANKSSYAYGRGSIS